MSSFFGPELPPAGGGGLFGSVGSFLGGVFDTLGQAAGVAQQVGSALNSFGSGLSGVQAPSYVPPIQANPTPPVAARPMSNSNTLLLLVVAAGGLYLLAKK